MGIVIEIILIILNNFVLIILLFEFFSVALHEYTAVKTILFAASFFGEALFSVISSIYFCLENVSLARN